MIECVILSKTELLLLIVAWMILFFYHLKSGYKWEKALLWSLLFLPVLYFSINMVTEAVTTDEPGYEVCITDVRSIKGKGEAFAVLYEYKLAQFTEGTLFLLIPQSIKEMMGADGIWRLYKITHWLLIYLICLLTANVWRKHILVDRGGELIGLPRMQY